MVKLFLFFICSLLILGCTSRNMSLQTDMPNGNDFRLVFGRMLLDYDEIESASASERAKIYERQLNAVLKADPKTVDCLLVVDSINFGEPGSSGVAAVQCKNPIKLMVQNGIYNREGKPFYSYTISSN
jgi:hypothetical protein